MIKLITVLCSIVPIITLAQHYETISIKNKLLNQADTLSLGLSRNNNVETYSIFTATDSTNHYCNGVAITIFKKQLYCMWQTSPTNEDEATTSVVYAHSTDQGKTWSPPITLHAPQNEQLCTSGGWIATTDTLIAFINIWPDSISPWGGFTYFKTSANGTDWSSVQPVMMHNGEQLCGVMEQDPHILNNNLIISAAHFQPGLQVCPIFTTDPTGRTNWQKGTFIAEDNGKQSRELEPSLFIRPNGSIVMIFRDQKSTFRKLASESTDNGQTWSTTQITNIPDCRQKQCAGNLDKNNIYMVGCPVNAKRRYPLCLLLSTDGYIFDKAILLRSGTELPSKHWDGKAKTIGYSYPKAIADEKYLYVAYATNKEAIELTRVLIKK